VVKLEPSTEAAQHLQLADVILEVEGTYAICTTKDNHMG
jgi:hypothetical protein